MNWMGWRRTALAGAVTISLWQIFLIAPWSGDKTYALTSSTGMNASVRTFLYFYRHLGLFPIAPATPPTDFSAEGARALLKSDGARLQTQIGYFPRHGEMGRIWLYLPHALWTGDTTKSRLAPFHGAVFICGLVLLFTLACFSGRPLLGGLLVAFIGSHPFQIHEVYARENVFGWPISAALLLLAFHIPLIFRKRVPPTGYALAVAVGTGIFLASLHQIRTEPVVVIVASAAVLLTLPQRRLRIRAFAVFVLAVSFAITSVAWTRYFETHTREARTVVREAGGAPYEGPVRIHHPVWHPVYCGLGDFGSDRGFAWKDSVAYAAARPRLRSDHGIDVTPTNPYCHDLRAVPGYSWSPEVPCDSLEVIPTYNEIIRDIVLRTIKSDPMWYAGVLARRAIRIMIEPAPTRISAGPLSLPVPMASFFLFAVIAIAWRRRSWESIKILLFALPTSLTAFLIYSGGGNVYYALFPAVSVALTVTAAVEELRERFL